MRCHQAQLLINKLLDAEIKETDYRQLQVHLDSCSKCRQIYEDLKAIKSGAKAETDGAVELEPSGEIWEKLKKQVRGRNHTWTQRRVRDQEQKTAG